MAGAARQSTSRLYTTQMLALSAELAGFPLDDDFAHNAEARSRTCGSTITLGVDLTETGEVERLGMRVSACAVGQSSAAIMALASEGRSPEDFARILETITRWLGGDPAAYSELLQWPRFDALAAVLDHKGRHEALLLPWKAMTQALSSAVDER